jgi:hypothetical protein
VQLSLVRPEVAVVSDIASLVEQVRCRCRCLFVGDTLLVQVGQWYDGEMARRASQPACGCPLVLSQSTPVVRALVFGASLLSLAALAGWL